MCPKNEHYLLWTNKNLLLIYPFIGTGGSGTGRKFVIVRIYRGFNWKFFILMERYLQWVKMLGSLKPSISYLSRGEV